MWYNKNMRSSPQPHLVNPVQVPCPKCKASIGQTCLGKPTNQYHRQRAERLEQAQYGYAQLGSCAHCGKDTKGGHYLPGHDSKHLTVLAWDVRGGYSTVNQALAQIPMASTKLQRRLVQETFEKLPLEHFDQLLDKEYRTHFQS